MKAIDEKYKTMLNKNINAKASYSFYDLVKRTAIRRNTSILMAYWILSEILTPETDRKLSGVFESKTNQNAE